MTQFTTQNSRLTAKLHSADICSTTTNILIDKINSETKWKVIGFLEAMSLSPLFGRVSNGNDTVVSVDLPQDSLKEVLLEKIMSYVRALGVEDVSVSYSSGNTQKQTDSAECSTCADSTQYDFVDSEEAERIAKRLEAGDQSEFELILTNPDELGSRGKVRRRQSSKNVISSMRKYRMTSKSRSSSCQPKNMVHGNKPLQQTIKRAKDVSVQAHFSRLNTLHKVIFPYFIRIRKLRFKQIKRLWTRSWKKLKKTKPLHVIGRSRKYKNKKCVNTDIAKCMRDFTCNTVRIEEVNSQKKVYHRRYETNKNTTTHWDVPLPVETYTQTENNKKYHLNLFQRLSRELRQKTENNKCSVSSYTKTSTEASTSNSKDTSCKCTQCSCCSNSCGKSCQLPPCNRALRMPQNIFPPFQYAQGLNQPFFYVVPSTDMQSTSNPFRDRIRLKSDDSKGNESKTSSDSSTYCSLSTMSSKVAEKESTKEKVTIYVERDENGNNRTCKRKVRSVKQIKLINAPVNPTIIQRNESDNLKDVKEINLAIAQQKYMNENKRVLKSQLNALKKINQEKLNFMKQLEELNDKLTTLTARCNNEETKTEEDGVKTREVSKEEIKVSATVDAKVMTTEVGTLCTQQVDTGVECVMMVDAFSEYDRQRSPETEKPPKREEKLEATKNIENNVDDDDGDDVESFESNSYRYTQKARTVKKKTKNSNVWDLPFKQEINYCSDDKPRKKIPKCPSGSMVPIDYQFLPSLPPEDKKTPKNNQSFLSMIFGGRTSRYEKKLMKQEKEISEIKKLISHLNNDLDQERSPEDDSDEGETIQFSISRRNNVKKSVTFSTPLVQ